MFSKSSTSSSSANADTNDNNNNNNNNSNPPLDPDVETETLDDEPRNIILGIIAELRKGMDLHRVTLPTFVLEPRSMLERISDFMSHPEILLDTSQKPDPVDRFIDVLRYFLSGWHIRPKGVKKPYNPVLGEIFRCQWNFDNKTESFYICEQVSHHPPISAYYYASPQNNLIIYGDVRPKSKFLGNSAATLMHGISKVVLTNVKSNVPSSGSSNSKGKNQHSHHSQHHQRQSHHKQHQQQPPHNSSSHTTTSQEQITIPREEYQVNLPNVYARGILFGTMYIEMGDSVQLKCPANRLVCDLKFDTKGFFSGTYNGVSGKITDESTGEVLYTISGKWTEVMYIQRGKNGEKQVLFDASKTPIHPKTVPAESDQEQFESRRLWSRVTEFLTRSRNIDKATVEKSKIEDNQRALAKERQHHNVHWEPRFFGLDEETDIWTFKHAEGLSSDPTEATQQLKQVIFAKSDPKAPHAKFWKNNEYQL